jgi:hypothetical protein
MRPACVPARVAWDDTAGQRTLFVGFLAGFAFYAVSFVAPFLLPAPLGTYVSIALIGIAVTFMVGWFIAVRRGFRVSKAAGPNRMERKLKAHRDEEREKLRRARMRR